MKRYRKTTLDDKLKPLKTSELKLGKIYYDLLYDRNDMVVTNPTTREKIIKELNSINSILPPSESDIERWVSDSHLKKGLLSEEPIKDYQFVMHPDIHY